jgi:hypothetical protein
MSYDIYLRGDPCPCCKRDADNPSLPKPTYNLTPIFDLALTGEPFPNPDIGEAGVVLFHLETDRPRGLRLLSGKRGSDTVEQLETALRNMNDPERQEEFLVLEPNNGWGTFSGAIEVVGRLLWAAKKYPTHTWEIY